MSVMLQVANCVPLQEAENSSSRKTDVFEFTLEASDISR